MIYLLLVTAITIVADGLMVVCWLLNFKNFNSIQAAAAESHHPELQPLPAPMLAAHPTVAILLAVRNEENNLALCLDHLLAQTYPTEKIHIWIGNDSSTDNTQVIAQQYAAHYEQVHLVEVQHALGDAKAKANVIAHLAQANRQSSCCADVLLVTDADTRPPRYWVSGMLQSWQQASVRKPTGIMTGVTLVQGKHAWAQLQRIDWLFALGMVKVVSDMGFATATMGNNMLMTRKAYEATGGYESLPFSITEDFQILQEITRQGFGFGNNLHQYVANFTMPMPDFAALLEQRKRWMHGAVRLPWLIVTLLVLQALFFPAAILLAFFNLKTALLMLAAKTTIQSSFIMLIIQRLQLSRRTRYTLYLFLIPYDLYAAVVTLATIGYYYLPTKTRWKGRTF